MKVGFIRCQQTEDYCPSTTCLKIAREKTFIFQGVEEEITVVGVNSCGGCPGKRTVLRVEEMIKRGADTIVLASCITKGNPMGFPCPNKDKMLEVLTAKFGDKVKIFDQSH